MAREVHRCCSTADTGKKPRSHPEPEALPHSEANAAYSDRIIRLKDGWVEGVDKT
jgi:hypothetical protein